MNKIPSSVLLDFLAIGLLDQSISYKKVCDIVQPFLSIINLLDRV
jgi:hypothetical protein